MDKKKKEAKKDRAVPKEPAQGELNLLAQSQIANSNMANVLDGPMRLVGVLSGTMFEHKDDLEELVAALEEREAKSKKSQNAAENGVRGLKDVIYILAIERTKWKLNLQRGSSRQAAEELVHSLGSRLCPGAAEKPLSFQSLKLYINASKALGHGALTIVSFLDDWLDHYASSISNVSHWIDPFVDWNILRFWEKEDEYKMLDDYRKSPQDRLKASLDDIVATRDSLLSRIKIQSEHFNKAFEIVDKAPDDAIAVRRAPALPEKPWTREEEDKCRAFVNQRLSNIDEEVMHLIQSSDDVYSHFLPSAGLGQEIPRSPLPPRS